MASELSPHILWATCRADIFAKANRDRLLKGCIFNDLKRDVLGGSHKFVIEIDDSDFSCQQKNYRKMYVIRAMLTTVHTQINLFFVLIFLQSKRYFGHLRYQKDI